MLVLSGRSSRLTGSGASRPGLDDFLPKPFHYPELLARVSAVLRRRTGLAAGRSGSATWPSTRSRASVTVGDRRVELANKEFALLRALAAEPRRVFTKDELLRDVWGSDRRAGRGRSTRTPAACGASSIRMARGTSSTAGASATGSSTGDHTQPTSERSTAPCMSFAAPLQALVLLEERSGQPAGGTARRQPARSAGDGRERPAGPGRGAQRRRAGPPEGSRSTAARSCSPASSAGARRRPTGGGIRLYWDAGPAPVEGDPRRMAQAFDNLIANALEHGGPPVVVTGARVAGRVRVTIANGRGTSAHPGRGDPRRGHGTEIVSEVASAHRGPVRALPDRQRLRCRPRASPGRAGIRAGGVSRRARALVFLTAALVCAVLAAIVAGRYRSRIEARYGPLRPVVVATAELPAGETDRRPAGGDGAVGAAGSGELRPAGRADAARRCARQGAGRDGSSRARMCSGRSSQCRRDRCPASARSGAGAAPGRGGGRRGRGAHRR